MKTTKFFFAAILLLFFATSCSPRLSGTWIVKGFETLTPGQPGASLHNIGTIQFNPNGTGEKNVNYTLLGLTYSDTHPFKWTAYDGGYMTILSEGSEFSKTWIIVHNKKKSQLWKSTDGANKIQVLELEKKPKP